MIDVQSVTKLYGPVRAVHDASFTVPTGAVVGVLGPNGAGKSTTVRMIAGTVPPTSGRVAVDGLDTLADSRAVRQRLGYLPEANPLPVEMRVTEYLRHRANLFGIHGRRARHAADAAIERCWLADMRTRRLGALSKGYRQRVGLAASLLHDPPVLLLDEPTSGLDPAQIRETRDLIRQLAGDRTMLIVSHALAEVEQTCDRLVIFASGEVKADGEADDIVRRHGPGNVWDLSVRTTDDHPAPAVRDLLMKLPGVERVEPATDPSAPADGPWFDAAVHVAGDAQRPGEALGAALADAGLHLRTLAKRRISLEEVYINLVSTDRRRDRDRAATPAGGAGAAA